MKTAALLLAAASLAGCATSGAAPVTPEPAAAYRAAGAGWSLAIGRTMVFTGPDGTRLAQPTPRPIIGFAGEIYRTPRMDLNIVHARCIDATSGAAYPDKVQLTVDGRRFDGCGGR
ncbi:hypothetical protein [Sphingomonas ginkgonis]|uniref:hypothetical protein n=1 Tax=Sphingomonas ginkgonis TaxID=2315330 RepID=UPI00163AFB28|nr:hypothetical protein [Sphingomonas ginkgonis]